MIIITTTVIVIMEIPKNSKNEINNATAVANTFVRKMIRNHNKKTIK